MNKSKKIKKSSSEVVIHDKKNDKVVNSRILTISSIVFVVILVGALLFDQLYESTLLTVDGKKHHLSDLSYYFYSVESQISYYDQLFGGNGAYWDMPLSNEDTTTIREQARQDAIDTALYNEVLYKEAVSEGYALTEEEKTTVDDQVKNMLESELSPETIKKGSFTKAYLTDIVSKTTLVERYRKDKIDALDIDDEGIKAGINYEQYRQYNLEYLFTSKKTTDAEGNSIDKTEEQKTASADKLKEYAATAKTTEDWSKFLPEDEKDITYQTLNITESNGTFSVDQKAQIMAMNNKDVTDVLETDTGYYVVRMINNNSSESYDSEVNQAITNAENEAFNKVYDEILTKHSYKVNERALNSLRMGSLILG